MEDPPLACCLQVNNVKSSLNLRPPRRLDDDDDDGYASSSSEDDRRGDASSRALAELLSSSELVLTRDDAAETFVCAEHPVVPRRLQRPRPLHPPCPRCSRTTCCPGCRRRRPCRRPPNDLPRHRLSLFINRSGVINVTGSPDLESHCELLHDLLPDWFLRRELCCLSASDLLDRIVVDNLSAHGSLYHGGDASLRDALVDLDALRLHLLRRCGGRQILSARFNTERFPGLILRLGPDLHPSAEVAAVEPHAGSGWGTLSLFSSGSVVLVGTNDFGRVEQVRHFVQREFFSFCQLAPEASGITADNYPSAAAAADAAEE